jgi:formylmethanofuran:tetrahydromethanopterin formyltransferase
LYYEQYAGTSYGLSTARGCAGRGTKVSGNSGVPEWNKYEMTPGARHGSTIVITIQQYDALRAAFGGAVHP